jgi:hypothetical protein
MLCAACLTVGVVVVAPGCDSGSGEIPLAKVGPPPADFNKPSNTKAPAGGSPVDANAMRR